VGSFADCSERSAEQSAFAECLVQSAKNNPQRVQFAKQSAEQSQNRIGWLAKKSIFWQLHMQISSVRAVPLSAISPEVAARPGVASGLRYDELTDRRDANFEKWECAKHS
jgi:hypothetical protein